MKIGVGIASRMLLKYSISKFSLFRIYITPKYCFDLVSVPEIFIIRAAELLAM